VAVGAAVGFGVAAGVGVGSVVMLAALCHGLGLVVGEQATAIIATATRVTRARRIPRPGRRSLPLIMPW
jgi:molybdopterin-binding protein